MCVQPDITTDYSYDNFGRLTQLNAGNDYVNFQYHYNVATDNPSLDLTYDDLDRLTFADYGIDDSNEAFTLDKLGNREEVNLRDDSDESYQIDDLTNRYESIDSESLAYDAAGNLTIAEYAYDALGRRIKKTDSVANETVYYYYSTDWQVLIEYSDSGDFERKFVYGNYIDEPLLMDDGSSDYYYLHNHLYSSVALTDSSGTVVERYEYDVYGKFHVLDPNFSDDADNTSDFENPYLFTGRRVDILDNSSLTIQYNRNRYYSPQMGRWLTPEPLGITPNPQKPNRWGIRGQYIDGISLYQYITSNPLCRTDALGLRPYFSVGAYLGLGASASVNSDIDEEDCCCKDTGKLIKYGKKKLYVSLDVHAGIGVGLRAVFGGAGVDAVWQGPGLTGTVSGEFKKNECTKEDWSGAVTDSFGTDLGGNVTVGLGAWAGVNGAINGDFTMDVSIFANNGRIKGSVKGCADIGVAYEAWFLGWDSEGSTSASSCKTLWEDTIW